MQHERCQTTHEFEDHGMGGEVWANTPNRPSLVLPNFNLFVSLKAGLRGQDFPDNGRALEVISRNGPALQAPTLASAASRSFLGHHRKGKNGDYSSK